MKAMIFAAGLGTRLKPLTDTMPKAMVPLCGKPLIQHIIEKLADNGFSDIVVNVHHFSSQIIDFLRKNNNFGINISISDETGCLLDTGGGVKKAANLLGCDEPFLIHNVDIISNADLGALYREHQQSGALATLLVSKRQSSRFLLVDERNRLCGWTDVRTGEVKSPLEGFDMVAYQRFSFSGIHVMSPSAFAIMTSYPDRFPIMDFYLKEAARQNFRVKVDEDLRLIDVGKLQSLQEAETLCKELEQSVKS